jgi:hypothetical protein
VRELLAAADDRSVILAAGDELALTFDTAHLPPPPPGFRRTVFLQSIGWDKDADRNTWEAKQVEPLPLPRHDRLSLRPRRELPGYAGASRVPRAVADPGDRSATAAWQLVPETGYKRRELEMAYLERRLPA